MKKYSAYSLIELMITIGIFGILASLAVPSFSSFLQNGAMTTNTNNMISVFHIARSEAIKRGARVSVCSSKNAFDASPSCEAAGTWESGVIVWADSSNDNIVDAGETIIKLIDGVDGSGVTIRGTADVTNYVSFGLSGLPNDITGNNFSGTISICDSRGLADARAVRILASGRIRGTQSVAAVGGAC